MKKENTLLILWIIYGFVFIRAIDSLLFLFTNLVYFGTSQIGIPDSKLKFIIPVITLLSYAFTAIFVLKRIKTNSNSTGIFLSEFPKHLFTVLILIAIFLNPITNKLTGLFAEYNTTVLSGNGKEFVDLYGSMQVGLGFSRWITLIVMAYIYYNRYNMESIKSKA
jgi:hypothetical protein